MVTRLEQPDPDLTRVAQVNQQIQALYYFHFRVGQQVRKRLLVARGEEL